MTSNLYVAWQDHETRTWHTIARLRRLLGGYEFVFTHGAAHLHTIPTELFRMDVNSKYISNELFPVFRNRLLQKSRTDFHRIAHWLNMTGAETDFDLLSRFGLIPGTDSILIYPEPILLDGRYTLEFFVHGIRHMHDDAVRLCDELKEADQLLPLLDVKNQFDENAVALRCEGHNVLIGYVPGFYSTDIKSLLSDPSIARSAEIRVIRNNADAPIQLKLLCRFESRAPQGFKVLNTPAHKPLKEDNSEYSLKGPSPTPKSRSSSYG